jgi:hypothetical protein
MIQSTELRIGNWVQTKIIRGYEQNCYLWVKINGITRNNSIDGYSEDDFVDTKLILPIPITEEILLRCGFRKNKSFDSVYYTLDGIVVYAKDNLEYFFTCFDRDGEGYVSDLENGINSVHQLQNLYYALTSIELEINL